MRESTLTDPRRQSNTHRTPNTRGRLNVPATIANGVIYYGSFDNKIYAADAAGNLGCGGSPSKTCQPLWSFTTGGDITAAPVVSDGFLYAGSGDGKLYVFHL